MEKKLFLLDAYALIYRSYYAFINNPRINSKGINTSAVFGFTNTMYEILVKQKPTHIAIVFDPKGLTFRSEIFPAYKAQRPPTPEDIKTSIPLIEQIIDAFNIKRYVIDNYEADDVIGTLAKTAKKHGFVTYMMTPDKDYCQLVEENIYMFKPRHKGNEIDIWGVPEVLEKFEIKDPMQVIDILGLWGDVSDNIPGAPGIGEKTSKILISQYGSIEGIYQNLGKLKGKQKENLIKYKEQVFLSKKLATIIVDVPLEFNEDELLLKKANEEKLAELFSELEFNALSRRILKTPEPNIPIQGSLFGEETPAVEEKIVNLYNENKENISNTEHSYIEINNPIQLKQLIKKLESSKVLCFELFCSSTDAEKSKIGGIAFSIEAKNSFYVPFPEKEDEKQQMLNNFKSFFENPEISKVGIDLKFSSKVLYYKDIQLNGTFFDTTLAHYLLQPEQKNSQATLADKYLNYECISLENMIGKKAMEMGNMLLIPDSKMKDYACESVDICLQLKDKLTENLSEVNMSKLSRDIEMPLVSVLSEIETTGVKIDTSILIELNKELTEELIGIEKKIHELAGEVFNIASPKQMGEVLFERMKIISDAKMTKTKQYSTNEKDLSKLKDKHEIINYILDFRTLSKLKSTYVESLPKLINEKTGKIHTHYNQASVATGRLSSTNPNLQNIPIRTERGKQIRKAFVASSENHILLAADYSQIELRIIAHISKEENMIRAFAENADIHSDTAAKIFNIPLSEVTREQRSQAKSANFGIIYGISSFGLAENVGISRSEAKTIIDNYMATYPEIKNYMDKQISDAREKEYVETISGRRRYLKDINSSNHIVRSLAERNAINAPIQGSAADVIKIAMIKIQARLKAEKLESKMILQVHDELVFDVLKTELEQVKILVKQEMESAMQLTVPLTVDMGIGDNWLEAH